MDGAVDPVLVAPYEGVERLLATVSGQTDQGQIILPGLVTQAHSSYDAVEAVPFTIPGKNPTDSTARGQARFHGLGKTRIILAPKAHILKTTGRARRLP